MVTVSGDEQVAFATVRTTLDPATDFDLGQISLRAGVSLVTVFNQPQSSLVLPRTTLFGLKDDLEKFIRKSLSNLGDLGSLGVMKEFVEYKERVYRERLRRSEVKDELYKKK